MDVIRKELRISLNKSVKLNCPALLSNNRKSMDRHQSKEKYDNTHYLSVPVFPCSLFRILSALLSRNANTKAQIRENTHVAAAKKRKRKCVKEV